MLEFLCVAVGSLLDYKFRKGTLLNRVLEAIASGVLIGLMIQVAKGLL